MFGLEFEQFTTRILDAQDHAEKRLQLEIGTLRGDVNRRFDVVGTRFDEINERFNGLEERFKGVDGQFDELKELIQKNGQHS